MFTRHNTSGYTCGWWLVTLDVLVADGPRFIRVKVCVSTHPRSWEVGVSEEASFSIKRRTVSMKSWSKEDHDIGLLAASIFDLLVGDLIKSQGGYPFPDFERPADGFVRVILSDLGSVILDAIKQKKDKTKRETWVISESIYERKITLNKNSRWIQLKPVWNHATTNVFNR